MYAIQDMLSEISNYLCASEVLNFQENKAHIKTAVEVSSKYHYFIWNLIEWQSFTEENSKFNKYG